MAHLGIIKINKMHLSHWLLHIVEQQIKITKKNTKIQRQAKKKMQNKLQLNTTLVH